MISDNSGLVNLQSAGFYLPSVLSFYTALELRSWPYMTISLLSLCGATILYAGIQSIHGPKGPEENPLAEGTARQRALVSLFGKGPADLYPDDFLDLVLNIEGYFYLIRRPKTLAILSVGSTTIIFWAVSVIISLFKYPKSLSGQNLTLTLLYFALLVWVFRTFVVSNMFTPAHILENNSEFGYDISDTTREVKPDRPANWMKSSDAVLLKILFDKQYPVTPLLVSFYYCYFHTESFRESVKIAFNDQESIRERLNDLSSHGLVSNYSNGQYELTELGTAYLFGDIKANLLEKG